MLWRFFSVVGLYLSLPYDEPDRDTEDATTPLDPIDPLLAGRCSIDLVDAYAKKMNLDFGIQACGWTRDISSIIIGGEDSFEGNITAHAPTAEKFSGHFTSLQEWNILKRLTSLAPLKYVSKYFSVKKTATTSRAIFNGKSFSKLCTKPPGVNLPTVEETVHRLDRLAAGGDLQIFLSNVRHYFHQIPLLKRVWRFFGVAMKNPFEKATAYFAWTTLPMGWAYSPRICQSIAWVLLLIPPEQQDEFGRPTPFDPSDNSDGLAQARRELRRAQHPPRFVVVRDDAGRECGFITLTYDNVLIACNTSSPETQKIWERLCARVVWAFEEKAQLVLKEKLSFTSDALKKAFVNDDCPETTRAGHLGVEYALTADGCLRWRHLPKKTENWRPHLSQLESVSSTTAREVARLCGIIIWNKTVCLQPLCFCIELMGVLRRLAVERTGWDDPYHLSSGERGFLANQLGEVITNPWQVLQARKVESSLIVFTDASLTNMGAVVCDDSGRTLCVNVGVFPEHLKESHIFVKELLAAVLYTQWTIRRYNLKNCRIFLILDNSAAFFALENWYSSSEIACRLLARLHKSLQDSGCVICPILIISEDNPADTPSRGSYQLCTARLRRGLLAYREHLRGRRYTSVHNRLFDFGGTDDESPLRHPENFRGAEGMLTPSGLDAELRQLELTARTGAPRPRSEN